MLIRLPYGWPRSWWPQVGHFDQKIKVDQIASYCAMHPRCCSLWLCTFLGLHSSDCDSSACQTILISIGGRTLQCGVMYIFLCFCVTKNDFYHQMLNWQVKRLIKQHKKKKCVFLYFKISLKMWQAIHSLGSPRSGWPLSSTLCYKFVTWANHHTDVLLLFELMAFNMKK